MKIPGAPPSIKGTLTERASDIASSMADDEAMSQVRSFNQRYLHWSEVRLRHTVADPEVTWAIMRRVRESTHQEIEAGASILLYNLTPRALSLLSSFDAVAMGRDPDLPRSQDASTSGSLMEEAIASSQMEGAATTRDVAKKMLLEGRRPRDRSERMIYNNYRTMEVIKDILDERLTMASMNELHRTFTSGTLDDPSIEGKVRTTDDVVVSDPLEGTLYHRPPASSSLPDLLDGLFDLFNRKANVHPLIAAVAVHYLVGYIHPYHDGNGRLARALMFWYGLKEGYWFLEYLAVSKAIKASKVRYGTSYLLSETDDNDITYFLNYNLECMDKALQEAKVGSTSQRSREKEAMALSSDDPRLGLRQAMILHSIRSAGRTVSIGEVKGEFDIVYETARTDLLSLNEMGYLDKRLQGRKMMFFPK